MIILKHARKAISIPVLLASLAGTAYADYTCYESCPPTPAPPSNAVTYKVDTFEDNHNFCGYDVEAKPQVCVSAQVIQTDTTRITATPGAESRKLNAETTSDVQYTSNVSFGDNI